MIFEQKEDIRLAYPSMTPLWVENQRSPLERDPLKSLMNNAVIDFPSFGWTSSRRQTLTIKPIAKESFSFLDVLVGGSRDPSTTD